MICLTWFTLLLACLSFLPNQAVGKEDGLALHFTSSYGIDVKLPYFEDFHKVDDDLAQVVNNHLSEMITYLNGTVGDMLVGKSAGKISYMSSILVTGTLCKKGYAFINERKKLKKPSGTSPEFNKEMKAMFQRLLNGSMKFEKGLRANKSAKDPVALEKRKTKLFGTIMESLSHPENHVSIYFDWTKATFTDTEVSMEPKKLETELTEVIGQARYQGFGNVMSHIEKLINLFFWWSGRGWQ